MHLDTGRCLDYGFRLISIDLYVHRHGLVFDLGSAGQSDCPLHFHAMLSIAKWYVELTVGKEDPDE